MILFSILDISKVMGGPIFCYPVINKVQNELQLYYKSNSNNTKNLFNLQTYSFSYLKYIKSGSGV